MKHMLVVLFLFWFPVSTTYSQSYQFQSFWETKKGGSHEVVALGIEESEFQKAIDIHTGEGLELSLVDGYDVEGKAYINCIFTTASGKDWIAKVGVTGNPYQRYFNRYITKGSYRLAWLDSYRRGTSTLYAFIFTKKKGASQKAYHGLTSAQHQQRFDQWTADGWQPINVSVVSINGTRYYTAFYEKRPGSVSLKSFMTRDDFENANAAQKQQGRKIAYMNAYTHDQNLLPRFVAMWRSGLDDGTYLPNVYGPTMMGKGDELGKQGYFTRFVTGYGVDRGHRYDAIWFQPKTNTQQSGRIKIKN